MTGPTPSQPREVDGSALQPGELQRRQVDLAWRLYVAVLDVLHGNPRLAEDALGLTFRAEAFERFERAFSDTSPPSDTPS